MTGEFRLARHTTVAACQDLLAIEPLIVHRDDDLLKVMRLASGHPETRLIGVVDDAGVLVGVLPVLRVAESVIGRVVPEALLSDIEDIDDVARFGQTIEARTAGEAMIERAVTRPDATIDQAFRVMHARHLSGLYIVDTDGRPTGYLDLLELAIRYVEALETDPDSADVIAGVEPAVALTALIFIITYALIATERIDKTIAALLGGTAVVVVGIVDQEEAFGAIDLNVLFLLAGMMTMATILRRTGFFQWLAIRSAKVAGAEPYRLLIVLCVVCAGLSAVLDNVTTVVLLAPVTLYLARVLRVSPVPFLISQILASNIGGTATLIGDPPNILIGSAAGLGFLEFLLNMGPIALAILVVFIISTRFLFGRDMAVHDDVKGAILALDEREVLTDTRLLRISLIVIGATIVGFLVATPLGLEAGTIALLGAAVLLLLSRLEVEPVLREVEWPTLFFFVGLFMLVEAVVHVGIIDALAAALIDLTGGDPTVTTIGLLWLSGIASAIIDNIPYTATMIPVVQQMGVAGIPIEPLWWSLALGACLGGNATIVGASANVVVANMAGRSGHPIGFLAFARYGVVVAVVSLLMSSVYLYGRYLM